MVENIIALLEEKDLDYKTLAREINIETPILDLFLKNI